MAKTRCTTITLPEDVVPLVWRRVTLGGFRWLSTYVFQLIHADLMANMPEYKARIQQEVVSGLENINARGAE